jgi:hypothetical protein
MRTGSEGSRRTENELRAALPMLERHAPSADAVLRAVRDGGARRAPGLVRRGPVPRRWPGWLAPVAAAAVVAGVIIASLAISGLILRPTGTGPANSSGVFAKVPRYFVALPLSPGRAVVGATATGAVLGAVTPPKPYPVFLWVAAAGDDRTFVFAAGVPAVGTNMLHPRPVRFYRLTLSRSGHPGHLVPLPMPPETVTITGLALSPDGSKLAVSLLPVGRQKEPRIQVFTLATGAGREWVWPGRGMIGEIFGIGVADGRSNSWEADNRTLMFQVTTPSRTGSPGQLRLLDTTAPGGSLLASSTRIPVPSSYVGWQNNNAKHRIIGIPLITGDGTTLIAPFFHSSAPPKVFGFTITEFSVRTGKVVRVLYQRRTDSQAASAGVFWVNKSGTAMIASRGIVLGVQTLTRFTPLPQRTQRLFVRHGLLVWAAW